MPASLNWTWTPVKGSTAGDNAANWSGGVAGQIPHTATDNIIFTQAGNTECDLTGQQSTLGSITVNSGFTSVIKTAGAGSFTSSNIQGACTINLGGNTTFTSSSILAACTINLGSNVADFGNGTIGSVSQGVQPTVRNGVVKISNLETAVFADAALGAGVSVEAGGRFDFGNINYLSGDTTDVVTVGGVAVSDAAGANYIGYQANGTSYNPFNIVAGGVLNLASRTNIASYVTCAANAIVLVQGPVATPNVVAVISGSPSPQNPTALQVAGTLKLAAGSTLTAATTVSGIMNVVNPLAGGATVATVNGALNMVGTVGVNAQLYLNTNTLAVSNGPGVTLDYAQVFTNLNYTTGMMGNITTSGAVTFLDTTDLTQTATGSSNTQFTLPLITPAKGLAGNKDFSTRHTTTGVMEENTGTTIVLNNNPQ